MKSKNMTPTGWKWVMHALAVTILAFMCCTNLAMASDSDSDSDSDELGGNQEEPIEFLIKFVITGTPSVNNPGVFDVNGPGFATVIASSGEIFDDTPPSLKRADLSGAQITFGAPQPGDHPAIQRFTCLPSTCTITFDDGSVLVADNNVPLDGRLVTAPLWGFVGNSDLDFNPPGVFPQRIVGCGGLQGISGPLAGTVGSICFNGVFNIPGDLGVNPNAVLTGGSNCTITLHHPVAPPGP